eukprot:628260-Prorocentrum_minimum.AAC.1
MAGAAGRRYNVLPVSLTGWWNSVQVFMDSTRTLFLAFLLLNFSINISAAPAWMLMLKFKSRNARNRVQVESMKT